MYSRASTNCNNTRQLRTRVADTTMHRGNATAAPSPRYALLIRTGHAMRYMLLAISPTPLPPPRRRRRRRSDRPAASAAGPPSQALLVLPGPASSLELEGIGVVSSVFALLGVRRMGGARGRLFLVGEACRSKRTGKEKEKSTCHEIAMTWSGQCPITAWLSMLPSVALKLLVEHRLLRWSWRLQLSECRFPKTTAIL